MPNTREKLADMLESAFWHFIDDPYCIPNEREFADHLIANGVTVQKWIPVTEMYPRLESYIYSVDVMFLLASGDVRIGYVNYESEKWKCRDSSRLFNKDDVTHWMPLPEAPKGE